MPQSSTLFIDGTPVRPQGDGWSKETAYAWCRNVVRRSDDPFPVASTLVPAALRPSLHAVYAFARTANVMVDGDRADAVSALDTWESMLEASFHGRAEHPAFIALQDTARRHDIPITPLRDLIAGFRMDLQRRGYDTFGQLALYCELGANPVGRLVLDIHGAASPELYRHSDAICTGLRLADILVDLGDDLQRGRVYLPREDLAFFEVDEARLRAGKRDPGLRDLVRFSVARARSYFERGRPLLRRVPTSLCAELELTFAVGQQLLDQIEATGFEVLDPRPTLPASAKATAAVRALLGAARSFAVAWA